jgi:hypothetical protein
MIPIIAQHTDGASSTFTQWGETCEISGKHDRLHVIYDCPIVRNKECFPRGRMNGDTCGSHQSDPACRHCRGPG